MATTGFNARSIGEERTVREAVDFAVENGIGALELDGRHLWQDHLSTVEIRHMKRTYTELANLVRRLDSPVVGITLDTGHARLSEGLESAFETFRDDLRHLHIHDCVEGVDHHELGRGDLDLASTRRYCAPGPSC